MSTDRRRLLFRAEPSVSTETEPESVFYDNPAYQDDLYEKPKVSGKHHNHVSWDIDGGQGQGRHEQDGEKSKSRDVGSTSRSSRFSSGYESKNSFNDTNDELHDEYDEGRDVIDDMRGARSNKYYPREHSKRSQNDQTRDQSGRYTKDVHGDHLDRSNTYYLREPSEESHSTYSDTGGYKDRNGYQDRQSNVLDTGHRKTDTVNREYKDRNGFQDRHSNVLDTGHRKTDTVNREYKDRNGYQDRHSNGLDTGYRKKDTINREYKDRNGYQDRHSNGLDTGHRKTDTVNREYKDRNGYQDRHSNGLDTGYRKKDTINREPSWKKQYRKGGAFYITIDSDDSSGYPSSGTYRPDGGSVTIGSAAGDRRRSFSLSPQSSDDRGRAPYQTTSLWSRSPVGDRLTVEAAIHWPSSSPLALKKDFDNGLPGASRSDLNKSSPYASRKDLDRSSSYISKRDPDKSSIRDLDRSSPFNSREDLDRSPPFNSRNKFDERYSSNSRKDLDRDSPHNANRDLNMGLPSLLINDLDRNSPVLLRKDGDRGSPHNPRKDLDSNSPCNSRKGHDMASPNNSPLTLKKEHDSSSPFSLRKGRDKESTTTSILPLISGQARGRSPISSTSTGSSWRDHSSTLSISESFALQAKGYLMSRKLNDTLSSSGEQSWSIPKEQNQPLLFMPPGRDCQIGKPLCLIESDSGEDIATPLRILPEENEDIPLRSMPTVKSHTQDQAKIHRKLSSTPSVGSVASIFGKAHRKLSESTSGGSRASIKRDSIIPRRERKNSSIFQDLNLTFREVAESEFDSETDSDLEEDGPLPLENGGVANGSAVIMADGVQRHGRRHTVRRQRDTESPLPITSEDTEDMIVMIMSNRSPCVARFISMCGVLQLLCGFISMMSGASGYLSNISILSTGNSFNFPIGFYIGLFFAFSGGWGIKSSHTKRKCVNILAAFSSAFSLLAALFILVLIAYPGALKFSCNAEEKGLYIFHLVMFTTEIIFASIQCVMCAKSLMESRRTANYLRNRDAAKQENGNR